MGFRVKQRLGIRQVLRAHLSGFHKWASEEISTELSVNKMSVYDQLLSSTTKKNEMICEAHCGGGTHMSKRARRFQVRVHGSARPDPASRVARRRGAGHTGTHHPPTRAPPCHFYKPSDFFLEDNWGSGDVAALHSGGNGTSPVQTLDVSVTTIFKKRARAVSSGGTHMSIHTRRLEVWVPRLRQADVGEVLGHGQRARCPKGHLPTRHREPLSRPPLAPVFPRKGGVSGVFRT